MLDGQQLEIGPMPDTKIPKKIDKHIEGSKTKH